MLRELAEDRQDSVRLSCQKRYDVLEGCNHAIDRPMGMATKLTTLAIHINKVVDVCRGMPYPISVVLIIHCVLPVHATF